MKWYSAIVYAIGIALALFPKTAPAQEVLTGRGIICDTASGRSFPRDAPDQQLFGSVLVERIETGARLSIRSL